MAVPAFMAYIIYAWSNALAVITVDMPGLLVSREAHAMIMPDVEMVLIGMLPIASVPATWMLVG